jgi:hypothetical protein
VGTEAIQSFRCIEAICGAYASAAAGSREQPLGALWAPDLGLHLGPVVAATAE